MSLGGEVLRRLREAYRVGAEEYVSLLAYHRSGDPFRVLVATILSQNTTDRAALLALEELERRVGVTPRDILRAGRRRVEGAIRVAGMYRAKSRFIVGVSRVIVERFGGSAWRLLEGGPDVVRERLLRLPGVGGKTADVLMVTLGLSQTVPVDTHVRRVSTRLGLVPVGAGYEEARRMLDEAFGGEDRHLAHLLLIAHGRRVCRAVNPRCGDCVLRDVCRYYSEARGGGLTSSS